MRFAPAEGEPPPVGRTKPYRCNGCKAVIGRVTEDNHRLLLGDVWLEISVRFIHTACGTANRWHPAKA